MKLNLEGVSELVLQVKSMDRAINFWSNKLGFPIVEQWGYENDHFSEDNKEDIRATWLYIGGHTRLGLWLPRNFSPLEKIEKEKPISNWKGLYDQGGVHVHFALHIKAENFDSAIKVLKSASIDYKVIEEVKTNVLEERRVYFKDTEDNVIEFYTLDMSKDYKERIKL
ncbi:VOC family protein [Priestia aryabhattai]|uniref:VOC family protein n=1 Tax=Priestia aryabhattai TaxID=412384 RepID=UPI0008897C96|nr:Catechol 2,3-dioxygenase [Priestia aryabhattai B8W22]